MKTAKRAYGDRGEDIATRFLVRKGYHLLERNWRVGHLEVDIIAEHFGTLVFVEVKTRRDEQFGDAAEAVDHNKQAHLIDAARLYCYEKEEDRPMRFDIITVVGAGETCTVRHIEGAYSPESFSRVERARKRKL